MEYEGIFKNTTIGNLSGGDDKSYNPEESDNEKNVLSGDSYYKEDDYNTIEVEGEMEKEATLEVVDEDIKVATDEMEKDPIEIDISFDDLVVYECASAERNKKSCKR